VADNGGKTVKATAAGAQARLEKHLADGVSRVSLERPDNGDVFWKIEYE